MKNFAISLIKTVYLEIAAENVDEAENSALGIAKEEQLGEWEVIDAEEMD